MKNFSFVILFTFTAGSIAFASGYECRDGSGNFQYTYQRSDGGACCGRSSTELQFKNSTLKATSYAGPGPGGNGSSADSDPHFILTEGARVDLNNNSKNHYNAISNFAMNLTLTRDDGASPVPDRPDMKVVVSLVCIQETYGGTAIP